MMDRVRVAWKKVPARERNRVIIMITSEPYLLQGKNLYNLITTK